MTTFAQLFGSSATVTADAPGRVNLIGEHTDYNDGFVLPAALPLRTQVELARRAGLEVRLWSAEFPDRDRLHFGIDVARAEHDWADYVRGMVWVLRTAGVSEGFDLRIESQVPVGSGLSSSAALMIAVGRALRAAFHLALDDLQLAIAARKAETDFVGAPVGIMDQMACSLADTTGALFIDTRSLAYERVPLPSNAALLVVDSGIRHSHASGDYRVRREECRQAAAALGVDSLRELDVKDLGRLATLPEPLDRRARHVVTENARVLAAVDALRAGVVAEVGRLFLASHASMRDDFQISTPEIDALVDHARSIQAVYGARLTGGGFGGAIVALVEPGRAAEVGETLIAEQIRRFAGEPRVLVPTVQFLD